MISDTHVPDVHIVSAPYVLMINFLAETVQFRSNNFQ